MAGIAGFEPALLASKARALTAWLYPRIVEIRAGLEPVIATVKGLCPNHLYYFLIKRFENLFIKK